MLDDLRRSAIEGEFEEDDEQSLADEGDSEALLMGMTALERMFLSIFLFMNVTVLGLAYLLATKRISF